MLLKYRSHCLLTFLLFLPSLLLNPLAAANNKGEDLYQANCAICHGNDGQGGMGIPLSLTAFLESASDDYLKQTIHLGRPNRIMPSFYWMPEADIDSIIQFISSWRKKTAPIWDTARITGNPVKGQALFTKHCATCHGDQAQGGKGTGIRFSRARDLPVTPPALNNQGLLNSAPDQMLYFIIKQGRQGTPMPSASSLGLKQQDIHDLVSFIRSLQQQHIQKTDRYKEEPASLIVDSPYSFEETIDNVKRSIIGSNFIHIRDQPLTEGFTTTKTSDARQMVIYFCNFSFLYEALKLDPRVGMFLPCRITVTENKGKVQMMSINPKHLSQLFNNDALDASCDEMYKLYTSILEDASL